MTSPRLNVVCGQNSTPDRPRQAIRPGTDIDVTDDFQLPEIDDGDIVIGRASHERTRAIRIDLDSCPSLAQAQALDFLVRCNIEDKKIAVSQTRDKRAFSIRCELEPVGSHYLCVDHGNLLPGR